MDEPVNSSSDEYSDFGSISSFVERDFMLSLLVPQNQEALNIVQPVNPSLPEIYEPLMHAGWHLNQQGESPSIVTVPSVSSSPDLPYVDTSLYHAPANSSSDSESLHFQADSSKSNQTKKQKTAEERQQDRIQQQREASHRYRQKKRQLAETMEKKFAEILKQNEQLVQEKEAALEMVKKLKTENDNLRSSHKSASQALDKTRQQKLLELAARMKNGASDDELSIYVQQLRDLCRQITGIAECHARLLMSPTFMHQLVHAGFFQLTTAIKMNAEKNSLEVFAQLIVDTIRVTEEQKSKIFHIARLWGDQLAKILAERENLLQDLSQYFDKNGTTLTSDRSKMFQALSLIEYLRKSFTEESQTMELESLKMANILTPRQEAELYLKAEMQHSSVVALKEMWEAVQSAF